MQKLLLSNFQAPGDIIMLTGAVRDLHKCHPGRFLTDVRTSCPALWENNPYLTSLDAAAPDVLTVDCQYPLIEASNRRPVHFLHGFIEFLNERLNLQVTPSSIKGDIHLTAAEKDAPSLIEEMIGVDVPYWIIVAGGKFDYTIKWWHYRRWQTVVDRFAGRVLFLQVGEKEDYHPPLSGVIDLRGQTTLRDLVRLVYHAQGVVSPVTALMHLAAAVETRPGASHSRPCVVVAGGREAPHWEAYPNQQFLHTVGALTCCVTGGCWRSRTVPLGDGDDKDDPRHLCVDVVGGLPHCMALITPEHVCERIAYYFDGGLLEYLNGDAWKLIARCLRRDPFRLAEHAHGRNGATNRTISHRKKTVELTNTKKKGTHLCQSHQTHRVQSQPAIS